MNIFGALPRSKTPSSARLCPIASDSAAHAEALTLIPSLVVATAILFPVVAFMQLCATAAARRSDVRQTHAGAWRSGRFQAYDVRGDGHGFKVDGSKCGDKNSDNVGCPVFSVRAY